MVKYGTYRKLLWKKKYLQSYKIFASTKWSNMIYMVSHNSGLSIFNR